MAIHVALNHKTHYLYGRRVNLGPQSCACANGAEQYPFCYDADLARDLRPYLEIEPTGLASIVLEQSAPAKRSHHRFSGGSQSTGASRNRLRDSDGAGCPDLRADAGSQNRIVPGFGMAAGSGSSQSWTRRAFRLGLSDSACCRCHCQAPRDPLRILRITPGPKSSYPAQDESDWIQRPECSLAKVIFRSHARRTRAAPLPYPDFSILAIPNSVIR